MASFAIKSLFFQKTVYFPLNSYAFVLTIRDPLGARWCDIFQFLLALVRSEFFEILAVPKRCGPDISNFFRHYVYSLPFPSIELVLFLKFKTHCDDLEGRFSCEYSSPHLYVPMCTYFLLFKGFFSS